MSQAEESIKLETIDFARETLLGDVRDALLDHIKSLRKSWPEFSRVEQLQIVEHCKTISENLIKQAVQIIAADGRRTIVADVEKIEVKDGIKVHAKCTNLQQSLIDLGASVGKTVLIVVADDHDYSGQREEPETDPDQRQFNFGE